MTARASGEGTEFSVQTTGSRARIQVRSLAKRYGTLEVFRGIDFDVGEREVVAVVGPSGCGKTTLLRCVDGLLPVDEGEIWCDGERVVNPIAGMAMVFQHFGLLPWKTVYDNVAYGLRMAGAPRAEIREKVPHFIGMVGLEGFEHAYPYQISGGMQQRCGLARALAIEPNVLLMDEPFAAVDAQTREILQFELLRIWEARPTAMVFVTHSIEEAAYLSDQIVLLSPRPGRVSRIVKPDVDHTKTPDEIRRDKGYLDTVDEIWAMLRQYV